MGAIWGIIGKDPLNCNNVNHIKSLFFKMKDSMSVFPFERIDNTAYHTCFFACGHQYNTNEDENDISPIFEVDSHLIFCSDCFLYNRNSLIAELNDNSLTEAGDSQIAYKAFKQWGYSFVKKLRGNFSIAIYDEKESLLHLFSDHFSTQYLVYHNAQNYICFSNTYKPVLACMGKEKKLSHEFICNCYKNISPMNFYKEKITPYENVYHLDYATHITINLTTGKETRERYWEPLKTRKKLKLKTDDEYKAAFRKLYNDIVKSMLRAKGNTGILLSGGLDSSSVTAFAAPILKKQNKMLYSYTSVPSTGFIDPDKDNPSILNDETSLIELQKEFHQNLIPHYINGDNDSCISDIDYFQNFYDMPVKASVNQINIIDMLKAANKDNCSVVLTGGNGNATISYGNLPKYISINVKKLHFIKAYKEMSLFCEKYNLSKKVYLKRWLGCLSEYLFHKPEEKHYFLKPEDEKKYGLTHPSLDALRQFGNRNIASERQKNNFMVIPGQYIQKGLYFTNMSLKYHFLLLDPSLTVEMVEFCLSLPLECFVHNGIERRLIRDYLKDLMPEAITDMNKGFGVQTPDFDYRVNRDWDKNKDQIIKNLNEPLLKQYLDEKKITNLINEVNEAAKTHSLDKMQCIKLTLVASLGGFLRDYS